jgi:hypothetical protein
MIGEALIAAGVGTLILIKIIDVCRDRRRVSGFDAATIELLIMPRHEFLAKQIAKARGYPDFLWRKFTPLAVYHILKSPP